MTNEELYKDEAEKIAKEDNTHHPAVYKGKPASCPDIGCYRCDLFKPPHKGCSECYTDWLKSEAEPEKPVPKDEIKVGDTVKVTTTRMREGKIGTVKSIHRTKSGTKFYYVRFDGESCGHATFKHEIEKVKPEKKDEKMKKEEIKVGDTVKVTMKSHMKEGKTGTVRMIWRTEAGKKFYGVRFDGERCGYAFLEDEIEKVKSKKTPPRIVVYREGDTVTVKDLETGETASAVCSKDDTFDFHTGAFIAMARLTHFMDDIRMMRLEAEQIEGDIADMKMRFGALMGEGYKYPEGFFREEEE